MFIEHRAEEIFDRHLMLSLKIWHSLYYPLHFYVIIALSCPLKALSDCGQNKTKTKSVEYTLMLFSHHLIHCEKKSNHLDYNSICATPQNIILTF